VKSWRLLLPELLCAVAQFETLTVKETLMSTARLKLPETVKQPQVEERVSDVIRSLDIEKCQDSRISGCSGGEKRRLAVAAELLGDPALLFLVRSND
jgi:ABC-type multidrug transport system ATPase subunit